LRKHPDKSGFWLLGNGLDAYAARILLAEAAERTIDVQYYLYHNDLKPERFDRKRQYALGKLAGKEFDPEVVKGLLVSYRNGTLFKAKTIFDLDTEARETADRLGLTLVRAATAGVHPAFVAMVVDLLLERAAAERGEQVPRPALSPLGPSHDVCPAGCCPNPRRSLPALCGSD